MAGALAPVLGKHPSLVLPLWLGELGPMSQQLSGEVKLTYLHTVGESPFRDRAFWIHGDMDSKRNFVDRIPF